MKVVGRKILAAYLDRHPQHAAARTPLSAWHAVAWRAVWRSPADVKASYGHASILKRGRVVFNIARNKYRLVTAVDYRRSRVTVLWFGTHAEYDRIDAEDV